MSSAQAPATPSAGVLVPEDRTAIFARDSAAALVQAACFFKPPWITGYWIPADKDLAGVEVGLEKFLAQQGRTRRDVWPNYYRQVAGLLKGDDRFLFLSYFVPDRPPQGDGNSPNPGSGELIDHWRREAYWANDGGDVYFRVIFDLQKRSFIWYERNNDP